MRFQKNIANKHKGFSLVEMLMTLSLLTVVSLPMVMMIHQQKIDTEAGLSKAQAMLTVSRLFDAINLNDLNYKNYNVSTRTSVYCDPDMPGNEAGSPTCGTRLPLFERILTLNDDASVSATVDLYYSTVAGANASYTLTRTYLPYRHYRVLTEPQSGIITPTKIDTEGNYWSYEYATPGQAGGTDWNTTVAQQTTTNCGKNTVLQSEPFFDNRRTLDAGSGCSLNYYFRVIDLKRYVVKVYYGKERTGIDSTVIANFAPIVDICAQPYPGKHYASCENALAEKLNSFATELNYDQYPVGLENGTTQVNNYRQYVVSIPADKKVLQISVSRHNAPGLTPFANVSAIEVYPL